MGIYQTDQLQKLLNVLGDDIKLSVNKDGEKPVSLFIKNGSTSVNYVLSDLSVINDPPNLKYIPTFNFSCKMDSKFMETFVRGKSALTDVDTFSFTNTDDGIDCVIGYSSTNTNRVNIPMNFKSTDNLTKPLTFNANLFKEILVANKECTESLLEVSEEGLARLTFNIDEFNVVFYLVSQDDN